MARPASAGASDDISSAVVDWYRARLAEPARFPWDGAKWSPMLVGPAWETTADGFWRLPERSLGWQQLGWCGQWMQYEPGEPWRFTLEQARLLLWWMAVDSDGRFSHRDGVLQRLKGWGKDPFGACLLGIEAFGPARFGGWGDDGEPIAVDVPDAWAQTAAVSLEQTKNTMRLFPRLWTPEAKSKFGLQIGKETVYGFGGERLIQAVTSSPSTLEGARSTFVLKNETHHWLDNNEGHDMAAVIDRNATKSPDGSARALSITNAYEMGEDSVAERERDAHDQMVAGTSLVTGILYDSIEAPAEAPLSADEAPSVVRAIRGDSTWLNPERIVQAILDPRNPPSQSRRFWYNQIWAAEDSWVVPAEWDALAAPEVVVADRERVALFFDGSKSDDTTGLVAARVSDGHRITIGMWQKPPGERGKTWTVSRAAVDLAVRQTFTRFDVVGFFADPSHALDDESQERYWDQTIDEWHRDFKDRLLVWAQPSKHAVMWDMTSHLRTREFTEAAERTAAEIEESVRCLQRDEPPMLTHDGDHRLRMHVHNARRRPNNYGVSLGKEHRESQRKVDLAVCMVGAGMVRRLLLNSGKLTQKRSGVVRGIR